MPRRYTLVLTLFLLTLILSCTEEHPTTYIYDTEPFPDYHPPVIDWISPTETDSLSGTVELSFTVNDDNDLSTIRIYRNGIVPDGWSLPLESDSLYSIMWNTTDVSDGIYVLEVRVSDLSGNIGLSSTLMVRIANKPIQHGDTRQPIVSIIFPNPNDILTDTVTIVYSISDEDTTIYANIYISGEIISRKELLLTNGSVILSFDLNTHDFADGSYDIVVTAQDQTGNLGMSVPVRVNILNHPIEPEDRTPPVVTWLFPEGGSTLSDTVSLNFKVIDNDSIQHIDIYVNGNRLGSEGIVALNDSLYVFDWNTHDFADGSYDIVVTAQDQSGNLGMSVPVRVNILNHPDLPRVIWVPDEYETIQGAINASEDGDTVRVRAGVYEEEVELWDKRIWLESESGPEVTTIEGSTRAFGISISGIQDTSLVIRGFRVSSAEYDGINIGYQTSAKILNCIISGSGRSNIFTGRTASIFFNNVFASSNSANVQIFTCTGLFNNNIIIDTGTTALWNRSLYENPLYMDYNLIWQYQNFTNEPSFRIGNNNIIDIDPLIVDEHFHLSENSPCRNAGNPEILNLDGSISDIGAYGGPFSYPPRL